MEASRLLFLQVCRSSTASCHSSKKSPSLDDLIFNQQTTNLSLILKGLLISDIAPKAIEGSDFMLSDSCSSSASA